MIRVRYERDGNNHSLTMDGHAEYAEHGVDIVCAGASAIVCALLGWLENNSEDMSFCDCDAHSGSLSIQCEGGERTEAAFDLAIIGLLQIEDTYSDHIDIQTVGLAD